MEKEHVALTKCFFCGKDDRILLAKRYNSKGEPSVDMKQYHGKVVDYEPCQECAEHMKNEVIIIGCREDDPNYRTGEFYVVKDDWFLGNLKELENEPQANKEREFFSAALKSRVAFVSQKTLKMFGFPINEEVPNEN